MWIITRLDDHARLANTVCGMITRIAQQVHFLARFDFLLCQIGCDPSAHDLGHPISHLTGWYRIAALAAGASSAL